MGEGTKIAWTDHTFNPWWGCQRVSPGCEHCYAETFDRRVSGTENAHWGPKTQRRFFGLNHWNEPRRWDLKAGSEQRRDRVFCASMADVFENRPELFAERQRLWGLIANTPNLDWLLLTKRPENIENMLPVGLHFPAWPWPNVWLGTTVEDQQRAALRIPQLVKVPAAVHFLSCEPLLERITLDPWLRPICPTCGGSGSEEVPAEDGGGGRACSGCYVERYGGTGRLPSVIDWVIVGGESGPHARNFDVRWASALAHECRDAEVPFFMKQLGSNAELDPHDSPALVTHAGDHIDEFPRYLKVRQYPAVAHG